MESEESEGEDSPAKQRARAQEAAAEAAAQQRRRLEEARALLEDQERDRPPPASLTHAFGDAHEAGEAQGAAEAPAAEAVAADEPAEAEVAAAASAADTPATGDDSPLLAPASGPAPTGDDEDASTPAPAPAPSVRRSVLLDSLDDDDDMPRNIGIAGVRPQGAASLAPLPLPAAAAAAAAAASTSAAAAATTAASSSSADSAASEGAPAKFSLHDHLRQLEVARRKEEDEKRARQAEELEARRARAEEERRAREEEDARRREEERLRAVAEAEAEAEAQRQAAEAERIAAEEAEAAEAREAAEVQAGLEGLDFLKIPRSGGAKLTHVHLFDAADPADADAPADWYVTWGSKKKSAEESRLRVSECDLMLGQGGGLFLSTKKWRTEFGRQSARCFSILAPQRSLDLVAQSDEDFDLFVSMLRRLPFASMKDSRQMDGDDASATD